MPSSPGNVQPGAGALSDTDAVPGAAPVRRLTNLEYDNTLHDLLGLTTSVSQAANFGNDAQAGTAGFVRGASITGGDDVRLLMTAAGQVGDLVAPKLATLLPCNPIPTATADQDACAAKFIKDFGQRVYRRPLAQSEIDSAQALYTAQRGADVGATFEKAMTALITGFLQTPQFLYHWELGPNTPERDGNLVRFNSWEVASRLSYFLWSTMPDDQLFTAAASDSLKTPDQIAAQARRMLADDRAKQGLKNFHLQFLEVGALTQQPKDDTVTNFSPDVATSMMNETADFAASIFTGDKATGSLTDLLTSSNTVIDAKLAKIYGVTVGATGTQAVTLDSKQRAGLFTQLAFLTAKADTGDSHPVKRGDAVLRRLLCTELPVPQNVPAVADSMPGGATTRQRFETHAMNPCATCHTTIDPIGFAFEEFDTIGTFRTMDQGKPVDSTGTVTVPSGEKLTFSNASEFINQLAKLPSVQQCVATQWMRYMMGRREVDGEKSSVKVVQDLFSQSKFDLRELLVGLTRSRSFTHRSPSVGEVLQ